MEHPTDICAICGKQRVTHRSDGLGTSLDALSRLDVHKFSDFLPQEISEPDLPGYHITVISKGILGHLSKIQEELDELVDANKQGCKIMELVELSDLVGAIESYLENHHLGIGWADLMKMNKITKRAFKNGRRR